MKEIILEREKLIGAIKIMDGLFLGDILASQDLDFITLNSINHIVNTAAELPNSFENLGIEYLNLNWIQDKQMPLFKSYVDLEKMFEFIQKQLNNKRCVMIVSTYGNNRAGCCLILFLMMRFRWTLNMTIQFVSARRGDFRLRSVFRKGVEDLQKDMVTFGKGAKTYQWGVVSDESDPDEVLVMHTYLNTLLRKNSSNLGVVVDRRDFDITEEAIEERASEFSNGESEIVHVSTSNTHSHSNSGHVNRFNNVGYEIQTEVQGHLMGHETTKTAPPLEEINEEEIEEDLGEHQLDEPTVQEDSGEKRSDYICSSIEAAKKEVKWMDHKKGVISMQITDESKGFSSGLVSYMPDDLNVQKLHNMIKAKKETGSSSPHDRKTGGTASGKEKEGSDVTNNSILKVKNNSTNELAAASLRSSNRFSAANRSVSREEHLDQSEMQSSMKMLASKMNDAGAIAKAQKQISYLDNRPRSHHIREAERLRDEVYERSNSPILYKTIKYKKKSKKRRSRSRKSAKARKRSKKRGEKSRKRKRRSVKNSLDYTDEIEGLIQFIPMTKPKPSDLVKDSVELRVGKFSPKFHLKQAIKLRRKRARKESMEKRGIFSHSYKRIYTNKVAARNHVWVGNQ